MEMSTYSFFNRSLGVHTRWYVDVDIVSSLSIRVNRDGEGEGKEKKGKYKR